jgi:UDP-3-O-[3-hydroxymyristoyl] glucosamine N-acyltransferase
MEFKAREIAALVGGTIEGDAEAIVKRLAKIEEGEIQALSFLANPKYTSFIYTTTSAVVIVKSDFVAEQPLHCTLIRVDDPYSSFAKLLEVYDSMTKKKAGISDQASVSSKTDIGKNVYIGEFVVVSDHVVIGENVKIYPLCYIGENVEIGDNTILYPGVKIYHDCKIGIDCTLHAGVVIGADGFGFAPQSDNLYMKVSQIGNVIIEDQVEVGANTTIDRATLGSTIIRKGVKLDNLIQVGHNVEIGENTVIAAQTGIAGSSKLGKNCMLGGQVGIAGHIVLADEVKLGAQAGIAKSINRQGAVLLGAPAIDIGQFKRSIALFNNFDKIYSRLIDLEKKVSELTKENPVIEK